MTHEYFYLEIASLLTNEHKCYHLSQFQLTDILSSLKHSAIWVIIDLKLVKCSAEPFYTFDSYTKE